MMTLIAAAVAAAQPVSLPANQPPMTQMGHAGEHKDMDCCKDCCKDMAAKHEGQSAEHKGHGAH